MFGKNIIPVLIKNVSLQSKQITLRLDLQLPQKLYEKLDPTIAAVAKSMQVSDQPQYSQNITTGKVAKLTFAANPEAMRNGHGIQEIADAIFQKKATVVATNFGGNDDDLSVVLYLRVDVPFEKRILEFIFNYLDKIACCRIQWTQISIDEESE